MSKTVAPGIQKMGPQHYRVWWTERLAGARRSRTIRGTLEEAKQTRAAILESMRRREYVAPSARTLKQALTEWLATRELRAETRESTHLRYQSLLLGSLSEHLGAVLLQDLDAGMIDDYYLWALKHEMTRLGKLVSPQTIRKRHQALKMALDDAVRRRLISSNPAASASAPRAKRPEGQAFTLEEAVLVLSKADADPIVALPVRLALFTGMRLGEVLGLKWRDVALGEGGSRLIVAGQVVELGGRFTVEPYAKTESSRRTITLDVGLAETLIEHRRQQGEQQAVFGEAWQQSDLVCAAPGGGITRPSLVSRTFSALVRPLEESGDLSTAGATYHTLRHTNATLSILEGVPINVVSKRLGHRDITVTLAYYAHLMPGNDEAAAEAFAALFVPRKLRAMHTKRTGSAPRRVAAQRVAAGR